VRLVHHHEKIVGEIVQQTRGPLALPAAGQMAGIVLDSSTGTDFEQHLDVERRTRLESLGFEQLAGAP
jgi:hypothetical protein